MFKLRSKSGHISPDKPGEAVTVGEGTGESGRGAAEQLALIREIKTVQLEHEEIMIKQNEAIISLLEWIAYQGSLKTLEYQDYIKKVLEPNLKG